MTSARRAASTACASQGVPMLVSSTPASGPGAVASACTSSRPDGLRRSTAIERLPLFSPVQYRLRPPGIRGSRA